MFIAQPKPLLVSQTYLQKLTFYVCLITLAITAVYSANKKVCMFRDDAGTSMSFPSRKKLQQERKSPLNEMHEKQCDCNNRYACIVSPLAIPCSYFLSCNFTSTY